MARTAEGMVYPIYDSGSPSGTYTPEFIGQLYVNTDNDDVYYSTGLTNTDWVLLLSGDTYVEGPASATDLNVAIFDGTTGKLIKDGGYNINTLLQPISSGVTTGGDVTRKNDTTVTVAAGTGLIADHYTIAGTVALTLVSWNEQDVTLDAGDLANDVTRIYINSSGTAIKDADNTAQLRRQYIFVGTATHPDSVIVESSSSRPSPTFDYLNQLNDFWRAVGYIKTGLAIGAASTNLTLQISAGSVNMLGINFNSDRNNPNSKSFATQSPLTAIKYVYQDGASGWTIANETTVKPASYDDGDGTLGTVLTNQASAQPVFWSPKTNITYIQYGQTVYTGLNDARTEYLTDIDSFVFNDDLLSETVFLGWILVTGGTTDLSGATTYFIQSDKFSQLLSTAGGSVTGGTGDVVGPTSATDNAIARFDLTTGKLIQNSLVIIDDNGALQLPNNQWLSFIDSAGTGAINAFKGNTDDEVDVGAQLNIGDGLEGAEDTWQTLIDMPVTTGISAGTKVGFVIKNDGTNILSIEAEADGAGGIQNPKVKILNKASLSLEDSAGTEHTYKADTDGSLIIS